MAGVDHAQEEQVHPLQSTNRLLDRKVDVLTKAPMDKIESLNEWLWEQELRGLWQGKAALYREPDPFGPARLWKWEVWLVAVG